jgi:ABC-type transport system substrate-binding protein
MMPPPDGAWGMPPEVLQTLPGYGPDVAKNRAEARKIMEKLGYGPNKRLAVKLSTRNFPAWRDPAVIMISQLKEIYIDGELDLVDTALWYSKMARKDYTAPVVVDVAEQQIAAFLPPDGSLRRAQWPAEAIPPVPGWALTRR